MTEKIQWRKAYKNQEQCTGGEEQQLLARGAGVAILKAGAVRLAE